MTTHFAQQHHDIDDDLTESSEEEEDEDRDDEEGDPTPEVDEDEDEPFEQGQRVLAAADPDAVDAHRDLLAAVLSHLDNEEEDLLRVAGRAGIDSRNPDEMSHEDLARLTYELSENYPEAMDAVTNRFPHAEGFLNTVLHGESAPHYE